MRVGAHGHAKDAREAKVGELDRAGLIEEEVVRLEIAVKDAARVRIVEALQNLIHIRLEKELSGKENLAQFVP